MLRLFSELGFLIALLSLSELSVCRLFCLLVLVQNFYNFDTWFVSDRHIFQLSQLIAKDSVRYPTVEVNGMQTIGWISSINEEWVFLVIAGNSDDFIG